MKKTTAIILSLVMIFCMMPFGAFAAEETAYTPSSAYAEYDRKAVASGDAGYLAGMSYDQIASLLLDWLDKQIAKATEDFQTFEVNVMGQDIAIELDVSSIDGILSYSGYLSYLGGDFANLDTQALSGLARADGDINFIYGIIEFMADNADIFGKVFQWETDAATPQFDYGKVGEYIQGLEDGNEIKTFYNDVLLNNDIQEKFISGIAQEMDYEIPVDENGNRTETFDEIISNGIIAWIAGICEENNILSAEGIATLEAYDLRTEDIYAHIKNFTALVQSDNQVKIDTYYNYLLDSVVRLLLNTMLGCTPAIGAEVTDDAVAQAFAATYNDLALLEEISGGKAFYKYNGSYYQVTVANAQVSAVNTVEWTENINIEPPTVGVYTGTSGTADRVISGNNCVLVETYMPIKDYSMTVYSSYADAINEQLPEAPVEGLTMTVTADAIPEDITALMTEDNLRAMENLFAFAVDQGEEVLLEQVITFEQIEALAEQKGLEAANTYAQALVGTSLPILGTITGVEVSTLDVVLTYTGYATADEFICQVTSQANVSIVATLDSGSTLPLDDFDASSFIENPVATIVLDGLSGSLDMDDAKALLNFIDKDFDIDNTILDFAANYDAYNGVIGQANHILYGIVDMLVSDSGMEALDLTDGGNENLTANLQKICDTANDMMAAAQQVMNDSGLQDILASMDISTGDILGEFNLDIMYAIDFSSVENLYVSVINLVLDMLDDGADGIINDIHAAVDGLESLDAMAVAVTDYALGKCIPVLNEKLGEKGLALTVPAVSDATAVTDDAKDIIMTKLIDVAYDITVWAFDDLLNDIINGLIDTVNENTTLDISDVSFSFGVEKGADRTQTLTAMVDRVYDLAEGIIIVCGTYEGTDVFDRISAVMNAILPMGSMFSNCAENGFACDIGYVVNTILFDEVLSGNFDNFLGLFETSEKTQDVAADVSVTYALIKASDHIVDAIFPDTVQAENYTESVTVQEEFTSGDSDVLIAANNMVSINNRKAYLIPAVLELVRESDLLPYFAACEHTEGTIDVEEVAPGCEAPGSTAGKKCAVCEKILEGCEEIPAKGHSFGDWIVETEATCEDNGTEYRECTCGKKETRETEKTGHSFGEWTVTTEATCEEEGVEARYCDCGLTEERAVAPTGHADEDGDEICDSCGAELKKELSFFEKIIELFRKIIDWITSLFA